MADVFGGAIYRLARVPYGAMYQASAFSITTGATLAVPVTLTNTGSLTWNPSTFHLAYHWYQGATLVTWAGVRSVPPAPVPPGGSVTLRAAVVAPASAGTYTLKWDMVQETVTWFSAQGVTPMAVPVTVAPAPPPYGARYQASAFNTSAGATLTVPVTLTNTGSLTWNPTTFHLAYHWYQGATLVTWAGVRSVPPAPVPPGGSVTLQAAVVAPASAGTYTLKWDMVQETVTWFSQQGVTPMAVPVTVASAPPRYGARYQASAFNISAGATRTVPVTLTNTGSLTWNPTTFHLAYHWYQGATLVIWPGVRSVLSAPLPPGGSVTLQAAVVAPASAGAYTLKWDMVQETVTWFSQQGVATGNLAINVSP